MTEQHVEYCVPGTVFYDRPGAEDRTFEAHLPVVPDNWQLHRGTPWTNLRPQGQELPSQGWKIHVSATPGNATRILQQVSEYCFRTDIAFKFLCRPGAMRRQNAKYAARGMSGKFMTLYPCNESILENCLRDLDAEIGGEDGPYILSDLRWKQGPLYVRYGGFLHREVVTVAGNVVPAIEDPSGTLVPDKRDPEFSPPSWVTLPRFLAEQRDQTRQHADFPYRIERPLHFSNAGGVYLATDLRNQRKVVLKEARPHAGWDMWGRSAVPRLRHEAKVLQRLAGLDVVPRFYGIETYWEHEFLVMEYIEGRSLWAHLATRSPLVQPDKTIDSATTYTRWALDILDQLSRGLQTIHDRGVVLGDLHPKNVLVRPDGRVAYIDFEFSGLDDPEWECRQGAPGFLPPKGVVGTAGDRWALNGLHLEVFQPWLQLVHLAPEKAGQIGRAIADRFPVDSAFVTQLETGLPVPAVAPLRVDGEPGRICLGNTPAEELNWRAAADSIARGILASATPERHDRLFPGDVAQFATDGIDLAHGAAGVLYALKEAGVDRKAAHEEWLTYHVRRSRLERAGFYDGLHGVAYALEHLGHRKQALDTLERALSHQRSAGISLWDGLAGTGLNLLHFAQVAGELGSADQAEAVAGRLASLLQQEDGERSRVGLMRGWSGPALFFVRYYEHTRDPAYLDLARQALHRDLAKAVHTPIGVQVDEGFRVTSYLANGSAGIGLVLQDYLAHDPNEEFQATLAGITRAVANCEFCIQPTLMNGLAGFLLFAVREHFRSGSLELDTVLPRLLSVLRLQAIPLNGEVAFPGERLLRLSMDLATGSAGVLLAVAAMLDCRSSLPFLPLAAPQTSRSNGRGDVP
ncbi:class III lanthionine synthetase LanKC, partial [Streptomyces sp. NPDC002521]